MAETFFAALKNEMYYLQTWHTRAHSTLGYRTPARALLDLLAPTAATLAA